MENFWHDLKPPLILLHTLHTKHAVCFSRIDLDCAGV